MYVISIPYKGKGGKHEEARRRREGVEASYQPYRETKKKP